MKIFTKKSFLHKFIVIIILFFTLFNFILPSSRVYATDGIGGKLLEPICDLLLTLGDGVFGILQNVIMKQDDCLIRIDLSTSAWQWIGTFLIAVLVAAAFAAAAVLTAGAAVAATGIIATIWASIGSTIVGSMILAGIAGGVACGYYFYNSDWFDDNLALPIYVLTPENIFANEIPLFDVNFFNPMEDKIVDTTVNEGNYILADGKEFASLEALRTDGGYNWEEIDGTAQRS